MLPRRAYRAAAAAVMLACPALAACGDDPGSSWADNPTPTFVSVPPDPADDPQLDALDGAIDESREQIAQPPGVSTERLAALPRLVRELRERLGPTARVARVSMDQPAVTIRSGTKLTNWIRIPDRGLVSHPAPEYESGQLGDVSLDVELAQIDPEVPRRLVAGIDRRTRSPRVASIELTGLDGQRLTWRCVLRTDSTAATVIANLDGSVVAVRWWQ